MADYYMKGSFAFGCSHAEMALIEEAFQASYDLLVDEVDRDSGPEFLAVFPPTDFEDVWSGFRAIFPDPDHPDFGVDFSGGNPPDDPSRSTALFYSRGDFQPEPIAALIHRSCRETLAKGPIGFEWAMTCSKPHAGAFGGGWCAIFTDRIEMESTSEVLSRALEGGIA